MSFKKPRSRYNQGEMRGFEGKMRVIRWLGQLTNVLFVANTLGITSKA